MNDRVRASIQRMKARKLGLAKLMFLRADCRGLSLEAAERAWEVLSEDARRKLVRYADAAMSGLSVNYSMPLGCDRFSTETPPPAAGQESPVGCAAEHRRSGHQCPNNQPREPK